MLNNQEMNLACKYNDHVNDDYDYNHFYDKQGC